MMTQGSSLPSNTHTQTSSYLVLVLNNTTKLLLTPLMFHSSSRNNAPCIIFYPGKGIFGQFNGFNTTEFYWGRYKTGRMEMNRAISNKTAALRHGKAGKQLRIFYSPHNSPGGAVVGV